MSSNPASYDQGHTTFLEPSRQQAWLMLGRLHFTYGADGPIGQIDIKQQEFLAMSKVFVQAVALHWNRNSHGIFLLFYNWPLNGRHNRVPPAAGTGIIVQ